VLEVVLPDDVDLDAWSIVEEGQPAWEWCIPAEVLNTQARVRLLTEAEVWEVKAARFPDEPRNLPSDGRVLHFVKSSAPLDEHIGAR
jgi:hypothetical protein